MKNEVVAAVAVVAGCKKRKAGRKKFRETRHPVYRGVRERNGGKWVCEVREPVHKTRIWLGTYLTPELAARAHDVAALALKGEAAALNFADSVWMVPRAESCSALDIRKAALQMAISMTLSANADDDADKVLEGGCEETGSFWDEEAMFNMPGLMDRMAEAMLLTPPAYKQPYFNWVEEEDTHPQDHHFDLWR